jgi:predicted nucleic acid-binding protein
VVTLAEVLSKFIRNHKDPAMALQAIEDNTALEPVDTGLAKLAGELHAELRKKIRDFGLADAFVLATARKKSAKVLTGDPHFETIPEAVRV